MRIKAVLARGAWPPGQLVVAQTAHRHRLDDQVAQSEPSASESISNSRPSPDDTAPSSDDSAHSPDNRSDQHQSIEDTPHDDLALAASTSKHRSLLETERTTLNSLASDVRRRTPESCYHNKDHLVEESDLPNEGAKSGQTGDVVTSDKGETTGTSDICGKPLFKLRGSVKLPYFGRRNIPTAELLELSAEAVSDDASRFENRPAEPSDEDTDNEPDGLPFFEYHLAAIPIRVILTLKPAPQLRVRRDHG
ncbi:hypothetical protein KEM48_001311 [Puccinia striiformis f. sp. tritici PST-130]|nr:hypothetical protein KEM48_001311 [Puccinia striiformis f. sp. tritici PST-130]